MPDRRLAAILAADIVGYSALMAEDEAGTPEALRRLRRKLFHPAVAGHRGKVVKRNPTVWRRCLAHQRRSDSTPPPRPAE